MTAKFRLLTIIIVSLLIFSPALGNFFWGDDWYHIFVSQISDYKEFINFFSLQHTTQSIPFYRPISTQLFFFGFSNIFGLNALPFYLFLFLLFALSIWLLNAFVLLITKDKNISFLAAIIYGFSATNFPRLYYISNIQEISMTVFVLLSMIFYLHNTYKNTLLSLFFFLLALGCKETAIVLPIIILFLTVFRKKHSLFSVLPYFVIMFVYLLIRFMFWNTYGKDNYLFDFSLFKAINTLGWYTTWSFGAPELLVDYVGSGLRVLPRFYQDFQSISYLLLFLIFLTVISFISVIVVNRKSINQICLLFASIFIIGLLPVIFLPWHKFAYELTLPMIGFAGGLAYILIKNNQHIFLSVIFLIIFCTLNIFTISLNFQRHQSVTRSKISYNVYKYFKGVYPVPPKNSYFEFINDTPEVNQYWGSSKQIDQAISQSNLFKVLYKNPGYIVYYEDIAAQKPAGKERISISTAKFLNP